MNELLTNREVILLLSLLRLLKLLEVEALLLEISITINLKLDKCQGVC
ncbi:hypothetical protein ES703_65370 [subsurface metagenome]